MISKYKRDFYDWEDDMEKNIYWKDIYVSWLPSGTKKSIVDIQGGL